MPRHWDVPGDEAAAPAMYHAIFFPDSEVKFIRVREILPTAGGKYIEYINEFDHAPTPGRPCRDRIHPVRATDRGTALHTARGTISGRLLKQMLRHALV